MCRKLAGLIILVLLGSPVFAFTSQDEQINHYLSVLSKNNAPNKIKMLERLQWSGLTDARLFDVIESDVVAKYQNDDLTRNETKVMGHQIRALGYSGNEKYRGTLKLVKEDAVTRRNKGYAKKALSDLKRFVVWNKLIANSNVTVEGKAAEIAIYMKMLEVDNPSVKKLAARAIYHEEQNDHDLLSLAAEKLKGMYLQEGLDRESQDTAAWLSKALGQSGGDEFLPLLEEVVEKTPYKSVRKHAAKFIR